MNNMIYFHISQHFMIIEHVKEKLYNLYITFHPQNINYPCFRHIFMLKNNNINPI